VWNFKHGPKKIIERGCSNYCQPYVNGKHGFEGTYEEHVEYISMRHTENGETPSGKTGSEIA
ncbi:4373_t:CDS:2, partial [Funneliformis geosporum]